MVLFWCAGKKLQRKSNLDNLRILQDQDLKSLELSQKLEQIQQPILVKIRNTILNMQVYQKKIIFACKEKSSIKKLTKVLDLTKENLTFSVIFDLNYNEKNRKPIGIKFTDYSMSIQQQQRKKNKEESQNLIQVNTATSISNCKNYKVSNQDELFEQYPSISVYFEGNVQTFYENLYQFLTQNVHQSDFRSIYKTISVLGEGSSGTVFNVVNRDTLQQYAAKVIFKQELLKDPKLYEAIKQEIQLMKVVQSDALINIHQVFEDSDYIYLILDLFNGGTLKSKIKQKNKLSMKEIQNIMKQILQGVSDMHQQKIMHRDIKPENILFKNTNSLQLAICDLGLATKWDIPQYLYQNVGTPGYVAPEVYDVIGQYDGICDIYSCGIILYQLLFNKLPFNGESMQEISQQNKKSEINFGAIQVKNYFEFTGIKLLKQMLEKDPKLRISSSKCLKHTFFQLTVEDLDKNNNITLKTDLDFELKLKQKNEQQNFFQKLQRDELKTKNQFLQYQTIPLSQQKPSKSPTSYRNNFKIQVFL